MLDVITDFWKPVKKAISEAKPDLARLNLGSAVTFGPVPQALLAERKLKVTAINTYQFSDERMTSFVLSQDREDSVALIVANADGEQYLALSRRIPFAERMKLFDPSEVEAALESNDGTRLSCRDTGGTWKHWLVPQYKKEISGVKGSFTKGDYRAQGTTGGVLSQPFDYFLFTSDNNEYAVEVEKYMDGRTEFYATIYRRVSDIAEVEHTQPFLTTEAARPGGPLLEIVRPVDTGPEQKQLEIIDRPADSKPLEMPVFVPAASAPAVLSTEAPADLTQAEPEKIELSAPTVIAPPVHPVSRSTIEEKPMQFGNTSYTNGAAKDGTTQPYKQEIKTVNNGTSAIENDAIECDLRVANKIIDEAIRNEMRLSDVVRRVIALPVSNPESVHIPITLTESDFALLAIRYNTSASDRENIKRRIIEELNEFSGGKKQ